MAEARHFSFPNLGISSVFKYLLNGVPVVKSIPRLKMTDSKSIHGSSTSVHTGGKGDENLQYEETTTFSDPLPTKNVGYISTTSDSDEGGEKFKKNPFLDPDVAAHVRIYLP